jgi:hypothetical protein
MTIPSIFTPLVILLLAATIATTGTSPAIAPDSGSSAFGEGQFTFQQEQVNFSFDVKANKNGKGNGWAQFDNLSAQMHVVVRINCANIGSFSAVMTGKVQHSDDSDFPKLANVIFAATDGSRLPFPRADDITPLFVTGSPGIDCHETSPLTILPLNFGDIQVEP